MTPSMQAMDVRVLKQRLDSDEVLLLDVRTPEEHQKKRIKKSTLLPLDLIDAEAIEELKESSDGKALCVLCLSGRRSALAARKLLDSGFKNVSILQGGLREWKDAEFPMVRVKTPISVNRQGRLLIGALVIAGTFTFWYTQKAWWLALPALFGIGLVFSGATGIRGINKLLRKMPWNR
jgi:rhodanese-related sulfurtransferase